MKAIVTLTIEIVLADELPAGDDLPVMAKLIFPEKRSWSGWADYSVRFEGKPNPQDTGT